MSAVTSKYCMTMDSEFEYVIVVHLGRNRNIKFNWYVNGLYYSNNAHVLQVKTLQDEITDDEKTDQPRTSVTWSSFVSAVIVNTEYFSRCEIEGADHVRLLLGKIG